MAQDETTEQPRPASERLATDDDRPAPVGQMAAIAVVASILGVVLALVIDWFPEQASTQADDIDTVYDVLLIMSVPMFVIVTSVVLFCVLKFRMRPGEELRDGPPIHGNTKIEIVWTVIPALMMLGLCTYAWLVLRDAEKAPANGRELEVRVVGEQFAWTFFYPQQGGKEVASTQLYLPKDMSVRFTVQSKDVLHDFWVPEFRWKVDAVPGTDQFYRVTPNKVGTYPVVCAELCGLGHATMRQSAHVLPQAEFDKWLAEKAQGDKPAAGGGTGSESVDGKTLFTSVEPSCGACHALADAGTQGGVGPDLDEVLKGKDAAFIKDSIVEPDKEIAKGFGPGIMPKQYGTTLSAAEIDALVKYLEETTNG
jgi:cytochrome c oxidase subunit II